MRIYYTIKVSTGDPLGESREISGTHEKETLENILDLVEILFGDEQWKKPERKAQKAIKSLLKNYRDLKDKSR